MNKTRSVLLINNNTRERGRLAEKLQKEGYLVYIADNDCEATYAFTCTPPSIPNIVVCDEKSVLELKPFWAKSILEMLSSPSNVSIKKPLIVVGKDIRPLPRRFDALKAVQFDKSWGDVELARLIAHTLTPSN